MAARISPTNPRPEINTRQELFCRLIAEGRSQYESYTEAGYKATTPRPSDRPRPDRGGDPKAVVRSESRGDDERGGMVRAVRIEDRHRLSGGAAGREVYPVDARSRIDARDDGNGKIINMYADDD